MRNSEKLFWGLAIGALAVVVGVTVVHEKAMNPDTPRAVRGYPIGDGDIFCIHKDKADDEKGSLKVVFANNRSTTTTSAYGFLVWEIIAKRKGWTVNTSIPAPVKARVSGISGIYADVYAEDFAYQSVYHRISYTVDRSHYVVNLGKFYQDGDDFFYEDKDENRWAGEDAFRAACVQYLKETAFQKARDERYWSRVREVRDAFLKEDEEYARKRNYPKE